MFDKVMLIFAGIMIAIIGIGINVGIIIGTIISGDYWILCVLPMSLIVLIACLITAKEGIELGLDS
ncbi:MAG: hypothetical protein WC476_01455 [Phycisphaerae bacterium]